MLTKGRTFNTQIQFYDFILKKLSYKENWNYYSKLKLTVKSHLIIKLWIAITLMQQQ